MLKHFIELRESAEFNVEVLSASNLQIPIMNLLLVVQEVKEVVWRLYSSPTAL